MALLHASAPTTGSGLLCARRHYRQSRERHFRLPPSIMSGLCLSPKATRMPPGLPLTRASPAGPFLIRPLHRPLPPSLVVPPTLRHPLAWASSPQSRMSPKPAVQRGSRGAKRGAGEGPGPDTHHRGRWLGREAEVRKWPAREACPFTAAQPQSPPRLPDAAIGAPGGGRGASGHLVLGNFSRWPCIAFFRLLKFQIDTQPPPVLHESLAFYPNLLGLSAAFFPRSYAMVPPGRRLGTIFGLSGAEETLVSSGSAPPSFLPAPPTAGPRGSAGLTV